MKNNVIIFMTRMMIVDSVMMIMIMRKMVITEMTKNNYLITKQKKMTVKEILERIVGKENIE